MTDELPPPEIARPDLGPPPTGHRWTWVEEAIDGCMAWRCVPPGDERPCRWMENRRQCGAPSVARLMRSRKPASLNWWHYCGDHLYGRVVHDGRVWHVSAVPIEDPDA